jgi:hypothetical protein
VERIGAPRASTESSRKRLATEIEPPNCACGWALKKHTMMTAGSVLINKDAAHPLCFYSLSPYELEKELSAAGWTFFYMANAIRTTACGFNRTRMIHAALQCLVTNVETAETQLPGN